MLTKGHLENNVYEKLMEYSFEKCDTIMFIIRKDKFKNSNYKVLKLEEMEKSVTNEFSNYFLKKRRNGQWIFTQVGYPEPFGDGDIYKIYFYKFTKEIKDYLLSNKNLYNWLNPKYPEDIAFFKNGYCWLYSVAHEEICDIYCESEEEYNYLNLIGVEFVDDKFIPTPREELYYESY